MLSFLPMYHLVVFPFNLLSFIYRSSQTDVYKNLDKKRGATDLFGYLKEKKRKGKNIIFSGADHAGINLMHTGIAVIPIGIALIQIDFDPIPINFASIHIGIGSMSTGIALIPIDIRSFSIGIALIPV